MMVMKNMKNMFIATWCCSIQLHIHVRFGETCETCIDLRDFCRLFDESSDSGPDHREEIRSG